jgi:hypothetical protein
MAVVINGSGTVTGLSVGGLPDGTVDSDTLATDSVVAAKLGTNAVTADALKSDAIAALDLPIGSVLQVQNFAITNDQTLANTTEVTLTDWDFTITKVANNSKILCFFKFYAYYGSSPTYCWIRALANGSNVTSASGWNSSIWTNSSLAFTFSNGAHQQENGMFYDTTNASSVNFTFKVDQQNTGNLEFWGAGSHQFTFMEIAV